MRNGKKEACFRLFWGGRKEQEQPEVPVRGKGSDVVAVLQLRDRGGWRSNPAPEKDKPGCAGEGICGCPEAKTGICALEGSLCGDPDSSRRKDMSLILALKVHDRDTVATLFADGVQAGDEVEVRDRKGQAQRVVVLDAIPYGHKIALEDMAAGQAIVKYGEELGRATRAIRRGEHVHVHNLESMRGRGDHECPGQACGK